jgi:hypothetical protein
MAKQSGQIDPFVGELEFAASTPADRVAQGLPLPAAMFLCIGRPSKNSGVNTHA